MNEPGAGDYCFLPNNKARIIIALIIIMPGETQKNKKDQDEKR